PSSGTARRQLSRIRPARSSLKPSANGNASTPIPAKTRRARSGNILFRISPMEKPRCISRCIRTAAAGLTDRCRLKPIREQGVLISDQGNSRKKKRSLLQELRPIYDNGNGLVSCFWQRQIQNEPLAVTRHIVLTKPARRQLGLK